MTGSIGRMARLACLMATVAASSAAAQNIREIKAINESLAGQQRIENRQGTALDPTKTGYFRVVMQASNMSRDNLCPAGDRERSAIQKAGDSLWSWAIKEKSNWSAAAQLLYSGNSRDFDNAAIKPDFEIKFFSVVQNGSDVSKCRPDKISADKVESPLLVLEESNGVPPGVAVQISTWYNKAADQGRIDDIVAGASGLLGLFGVPLGLVQGIAPRATTELKSALDANRTSRFTITMRPMSATEAGAVAYVGLREPKLQTKDAETRVVMEIKGVSSMFSQSNPTYVSLADRSPQQILESKITIVPQKPGDPNFVYLQNFLNTSPSYQAMLIARDPIALSAHCELLDTFIRDTLKFSRVDAAVMLHAITRRNPIIKATASVDCLKERAQALKAVQIELTEPVVEVPVPVGKPADKALMDEAMRAFAALRSTDPENLTASQFAIFRFPLRIVDPGNLFGMEGQSRTFEATDGAALHEFIRTAFSRIGCWAYFDTPPFAFGLGFDPVPAGSASAVRKSAALGQIGEGKVATIQFRYEPDGSVNRISGIALVPSDTAALELMKGNADCRKPGREWMQTYLGPAR